jgi:tryptophan 2,3-dioxygenase
MENTTNSFKPEILEQLGKLEKKYAAMGQDLSSYLDGLLYADYLTYWDYIHLDTLLSLQTPKTPFPDEKIFIVYHQITELYFTLILHEIDQLADDTALTAGWFETRMKRINRYFQHLIDSFEVMVDGMDKAQFLQFRMSLLPASGFQSAQYRLIELKSTPIYQLTNIAQRENLKRTDPVEQLYEHIYWKAGATELSTGNKTLTLKQFEKKYSKHFIEVATQFAEKSIWQRYQKSGEAERTALMPLMRQYDAYANIFWPLAHYKSAVRYLQKDPEDIKATGGTNWQKYLPPRFQKVIFFPDLWSDEERTNWGKQWVMKEVLGN